MPVITIDTNNFLKGESTSIYLSDGGYSPDSGAFDIDRQNENLGLLVTGKTVVESSTNLDDFVAATLLVDNAGGKYYSVMENRKLVETDLLTGAHTIKVSPGAGKTYNTTVSSILKYNGKLYISSADDIWEENLSTFTGNLYTWWTVTKGKTALTTTVPHILFEFQGIMFITNGNKVWSWDGTTALDSGNGTLTLESGWIIRDVAIYNTEIHLACTKGTSGNLENFESRIFIWDSYSLNPIREKQLNTRSINTIKPLDGYLYFSSASGLYKSDGQTAVLKKYRLPNSRNGVATISGLYYFASGTSIYCYVPARNSIHRVAVLPTTIDHVMCGYSNVLHVFTRDLGSNHAKFYTLSSNGIAPVTFHGNQYLFERPVVIEKIELMFSNVLSSGADYTIYIRDEVETEITALTKRIQYSDAKVGAVKKFSYNVNRVIDAFRPLVLFNSTSCRPIRWIKIYWSPHFMSQSTR